MPNTTIDGIRVGDLDVFDTFIPWKRGGNTYQRYVHAYTLHELREYVESSGLGIKELLYTRKGRKASLLTGANSLLIAQKAHD